MPPKKSAAATGPLPKVNPKALSGKTVIITGEVEDYDRSTAQKILENAGATIAKSLNKSVNLVILGGNAGPKKLEKIAEMGVESKEWDAILAEIEGDDIEAEAAEEDIVPVEADEDEEVEGLEDEEVEVEKPKPKGKSKAASKGESKVGSAKAATKLETLGDAPTSINGTTLLVSGSVHGHTRPTAEKALQAKGAKIAKSLNKDVELVVLGVNPGPDKIRKINDLGIPTCKWDDLATTLDLPEPSEPPKKKRKA